MILRRRNLTTRVTPPISLILATRSHEYIGLQAARYVGPLASREATTAENQWVPTFAAASTRAVVDAEAFERRVEELQLRRRASLQECRIGSYRVQSRWPRYLE